MKAFFFKTMTERGRNRLRALAGQTLLDGTPVDQTLNVQSDKEMRSKYPLGTIFGSLSLTQKAGFYEASQIYPMGLRDEEYIMDSHKPAPALQMAYEHFIGARDFSEWSSTEGISKDTPPEDLASSTPKKLSLLDKMIRNEALVPPTTKKDGFYVDDKNWYLILRNIQNQVNTMMVGPTGTGKTELVMLACEKLGIDCHVYDMGSMYDPVAGLLGVHRLMEGGISTFDYAKFTQDIQKPGVVLLDELSRAPITTMNILFPCLDSRRMLPVEIAGGNDMRSIKVHPDCCFFATANVGAEYTGTMSMDRALVNRFFPLELDYMPAEVEGNVVVKRCGIEKTEAKLLVKVANVVRSMYRKQELSSALSTREVLLAGELVSDGWTVLNAMELVYLPLFEGTRTEGERAIVANILISH